MKIVLGNNYYIDVDQMNWTLKRTVHIEEHTRNGKVFDSHDTEVVLGYYGNFEQTVKGMLRHCQHDLPADVTMSIHDYVNHVNKANEQAVKSMVEAFERFRLEQ